MSLYSRDHKLKSLINNYSSIEEINEYIEKRVKLDTQYVNGIFLKKYSHMIYSNECIFDNYEFDHYYSYTISHELAKSNIMKYSAEEMWNSLEENKFERERNEWILIESFYDYIRVNSATYSKGEYKQKIFQLNLELVNRTFYLKSAANCYICEDEIRENKCSDQLQHNPFECYFEPDLFHQTYTIRLNQFCERGVFSITEAQRLYDVFMAVYDIPQFATRYSHAAQCCFIKKNV